MSARAPVAVSIEDDLVLFLENTLRRVRALNICFCDAAAAMRAGARVMDLVRSDPRISEVELANAVLANLRAEVRMAHGPQKARVQ